MQWICLLLCRAKHKIEIRRLGGDANDDEEEMKLEGGLGYWFS